MASAHQFRDRFAVIDKRRRPAVEIANGRVCRIDAEMMVDRGQEIAGTADAFDRVFGALIGGPDHAARLNSAARP